MDVGRLFHSLFIAPPLHFRIVSFLPSFKIFRMTLNLYWECVSLSHDFLETFTPHQISIMKRKSIIPSYLEYLQGEKLQEKINQ